jgi:predicted transposase YbfD/YdcC
VGGADKSNEIGALGELLGLRDLTGAIVTADAMHTHKQTACAILDKTADDVVALEDNQPDLVGDVERLLANSMAAPESRAEHGRIEIRKTAVCAPRPARRNLRVSEARGHCRRRGHS